MEEITRRVDTNLREFDMDSSNYIRSALPMSHFMRFYAFYGITSNHPIDFHFGRSSLAGSYFLSRCHVNSSILHKTDVRGDELKRRGQVFHLGGREILMHQDECIRVQHSFLVKTLVHSYNHDPEFRNSIRSSIPLPRRMPIFMALPYAVVCSGLLPPLT